MTTDQPNPSKPRRRWFQYSLRSLFVLLTVLCIWLGFVSERARKQRRAVEAIEELSGDVWYEYQRDNAGTFLPRAKPPGPKWLRELIGEEYFVKVVGVELGLYPGADINQFTDADLVHLKDLTNLQELYLSDTEVTDAGLVRLKGLTKLRTLQLENTQVTDAGLVHLKGLTNLQYLFLSSTQVTDDGLEHLKGLTKLVQLVLVDTQVTDADVQKLQQIFPNCVIIHYLFF